jgi:predicted alpha/beta-hydrolase family hydrolase
MALTWEAVKDPDEVKDYSIDWSAMLSADSDTIETSSWVVASGAGLSIDSSSNTDTAATVWLSGGTAAVTYELRNRVITTGGRTYDQTIRLKVKNK